MEKQLNDIEEKIRSGYQIEASVRIEEWSGADVIITNILTEELKKWRDQNNLVINAQQTQPKRRLVITEYSKELSWLFMQLKSVFRGKIDYISKYDFYGCLAEAAIDYLDNNEDIECEKLLLNVVEAARGYSNGKFT